MTRSNRYGGKHGLLALWAGLPAARRKPAARRRIAQARRVAKNAFSGGRVTDTRERADEHLRIGVAWTLEDFPGRAHLNHLACVHDAKPVGNLIVDAHIVRDDDHRAVISPLHATKHGQNASLHDDVQRGSGLIGKNERWLEKGGQSDQGTLTHPARKLMWIGFQRFGSQFHFPKISGQLMVSKRRKHRR